MSRGRGPFRGGGERENDRRRKGGASRRGDGDLDVGERLREYCSIGGSFGSGDGRRTADAIAEAIFACVALRSRLAGC